ncbi:MAG: ATP-binding cassette domain-containing protein, partial [Burkholderiales bacterium]|nr:ATP-binding cassette domain-containing protein [Burkholderiales bacterium]
MLKIQGLAKRYGDEAVFDAVALELRGGEFVALLGESGVGKSTLLNCIAGLDRADAGTIAIAGAELGRLDDDALARLRRERLGFVFQAFHVLPHL